MAYKIGDVARILGISTDLIRYYEEKGVVKPHKDKFNNYRYYDAWDVNFLLDCVWFKKIGFGIDEIAKMTTNESYDDFVCHLSRHSDEIATSIEHQQLLLERIDSHIESVKRITEYMGVCDVRTNKEFIYYLNRFNSEYDNSEELQRLNKEWEKYNPFTKRFFLIEKHALEGECEDYAFGLSANMQYVEKFNISSSSPVKRTKQHLCLHSAFKSYGKNAFTARHLDFMVKFAKENNYKIVGPAFGNLVCSLPANEEHVGYFEAWIPIER